MTSEASSTNELVQARRPRRLVEWFWRGSKLRQARQAVRAQSALEGSRLRHALAASELAARVLEPTDPLRAEPAYWVATLLYREAAYWALLAHSDSLKGDSLAAVFADSPRSLLSFAADGDDGLAAVQTIMLERRSAEEADEPPEKQRADAAIARAFVEALIRAKQMVSERAGWVLIERWVRTGIALLLLLSLVTSLSVIIWRATRPPDLALGKPWRASSSLGECRPRENFCLGTRTDILFHTNVEDNPWFELDLGEPRSFSMVEVENRGDCCPDVSLPLVLEVSDDAKQWTEIAKRTEPYSTWRAKFPTRSNRYVRVRAPRPTALHLVRVSVYAPD